VPLLYAPNAGALSKAIANSGGKLLVVNGEKAVHCIHSSMVAAGLIDDPDTPIPVTCTFGFSILNNGSNGARPARVARPHSCGKVSVSSITDRMVQDYFNTAHSIP
ncbi:MAG: hypothetical protein D6712_19105, partial [Chloroflexi bacterium]